MEITEKIDIVESKLGYGGWLRFFRIFNAFNWIAGGVAVIVFGVFLLFAWGDNPQQDLDILSALVELLPGTIMSFLIWRCVLEKSIETPSKLKHLLQTEILLHFIVVGFVLYAYMQGYISDRPVILASIIYYYIWATYLKKSKRVKSFYGENSF